MADPAPYTPSYSFSDFQSNSPTTPLPAPQVDNELANIAAAVATLVSTIKDVRRNDGALKNNIVTFASLELGLQLTFDPTNGTLVANAVSGAQASAAAALTSQNAAATSATNSANSASAAAASASSVNLSLFLAKANNLAGLGSLTTSRANLGLGSVATFDAGTGALNIIQLDANAKLPAVDGSQLINIDTVPVGAVLYSLNGVAFPGTVKMNGSLLSRVSFPRLWAYAAANGPITTEAGWSGTPTAFTTGDLVTTFRIPDVRGEFIRHLDDGRGVDTGRGVAVTQLDTLKDHTHNYQLLQGALRNDGTQALTVNTAYTATATSGVNAPNNGGTETRPRNIPLLACIKY